MTGDAPQPPLFNADAPLATVLAWDGLPFVLRRALTRTIPRDLIERLTFLDSLRSEDPRLREWQVALLALDIGVDAGDARDNLIGLFSQGALRTAPITRFCVHGVGPRQSLGAAFRAPTPTAPPTTCAAAFVYCTEARLVASEFVFLAGPSGRIAQIPLAMLRDNPLDDEHIERATGSVQLAPLGHQLATVVLKEALADAREQQS